MYFNSKKMSLLLLAITAVVCSRVLFLFFNDPEGPNLLIVIGTAVIVYGISLAAYSFNPTTTTLKKSLLAICIQILVVSGLYLIM